MKKYYFLLVLMIGATLLSSAQTITNGDFETWTDQGAYFEADGWENPNADIATMGQTVVEPSDVSPQSGSYSAYLETKSMGFFNMAGALTTGSYVTVPFQGSYIKGGVAFTDKPTSLKFYYKCNPVANDNCYVGVNLYKNGTVVADAVFTNSNVVDTWTEVDLALNYHSQEVPDTMNIIICSSNYVVTGGFMDAGKVGSKLWIDNMRLEGQVGVNEVGVEQFQVYPNPATTNLFVDFPGRNISSIDILSASGQTVKGKEVSSDKDIIVEIGELKPGVYFMKLSDGQQVWMKQFIKP